MAQTLVEKIIESHKDATHSTERDVAIVFDQALCQDATGTLVMLALEAMNLERAKTKVAVQYVDHNLIQEDHKNPDDHLFLLSAAKRFGFWYSRPGNGISHPLHMQHFGVPGETLIGSDSHTCAAGALAMLAIGSGGADVALAIAGHSVPIPLPKVLGVRLTGQLPPWVSAKNIILEMLRRRGVKGAVNCVLEYHGPGVEGLSLMDRHVIANMGAELGATGSIFPSDERTRQFLHANGREDKWKALHADEHCQYEDMEEINLSDLCALIAKPSSPENVVPVSEVEGEPIYQAYIGSSANPGYRDFAIVAEILKGKQVPNHVSLDINPSTRQVLQELAGAGYLTELLNAGARFHQAGCNGCIGMGQAPATGRNSLRTTPRNFPGRSGTEEDSVWLCSPEVAAFSALTGKMTDPVRFAKDHRLSYPTIQPAPQLVTPAQWFLPPSQMAEQTQPKPLVKGPNIQSMPKFDPLPDELHLPVLLWLGDNISTDEILPAGAEVLPFRSNIQRISAFCFRRVEPNYADLATTLGQHTVIAGQNYGQGSSREHAALAPRYLGLRVVLAQSFARIHKQNLINYGILPLTLSAEQLQTLTNQKGQDDLMISVRNVHQQLRSESGVIQVCIEPEGDVQSVGCDLSRVQVEMLLSGSITNWMKQAA